MRRKREEREEVKGASRGTPAEQFCTRERAPRPKRGTPVVIIRGPSECFWPRRGSLKFRRRPRKKERRIASHRVSPPTVVPLALPPRHRHRRRRRRSTTSAYRGWNRRGNINFSVPRPTYASLPPSLSLSSHPPRLALFEILRPWDFLGHGSVIWWPTDDRPLLPLSSSALRVCGTGVDRSVDRTLRSRRFPRLWARHTPRTTTLLSFGRTICL